MHNMLTLVSLIPLKGESFSRMISSQKTHDSQQRLWRKRRHRPKETTPFNTKRIEQKNNGKLLSQSINVYFLSLVFPIQPI